MESRIIKLEMLFSSQDETLRELSKELFLQQQDATKLRRRLDLLEKKIAAMEQPDEIAGNEPPPHY